MYSMKKILKCFVLLPINHMLLAKIGKIAYNINIMKGRLYDDIFRFSFRSSNEISIFIVFGCCFIPIFALVVVCFIKLLLKQKKRVSKSKNNSTIRYLDYFGGDDNIISVTKNLSRVSVIVKDVDLVNLESIKNQGIGVMITGNTIKCSSQEFADQIKE